VSLTEKWDERELAALRRLWADGIPVRLIARRFGRPVHEVETKAGELRLGERLEPPEEVNDPSAPSSGQKFRMDHGQRLH
jgi:hypothetical protein